MTPRLIIHAVTTALAVGGIAAAFYISPLAGALLALALALAADKF